MFLDKVKTILREDNFFDVSPNKSLTTAEKKILKLLLEGKGNKEIAYIIDRAVRTVERHRSNIMHKFNVDSIVDLVKKTALMDLDDVK